MSEDTKEFEDQWNADEQAKQPNIGADAVRQAAEEQANAAADEYLQAHADLESEGK